MEQERTLEPFHKLVLQDNISLTLVQDSDNTVRLTSGANLIDQLMTEVVEGVLTISDENACNWQREYDQQLDLVLSIGAMPTIEFWGGGTLGCEGTLEGDSLLLELHDASGLVDLNIATQKAFVKIHTGPGDATISGTTGNLFTFSAANGYIDCTELITPIATAINNGTGDIQMHSNDLLNVEITYTGSVKYTGNPTTINSKLTGSGQLVEL